MILSDIEVTVLEQGTYSEVEKEYSIVVAFLLS